MCAVSRQLSVLLGWIISPVVLGGSCVIMAFLLLLVQGQRGRYSREMARFKDEWSCYRREMQAKVRISQTVKYGLCQKTFKHLWRTS